MTDQLRKNKDIEEMLSVAMLAVLNAEHGEDETYEEGVEAALLWVLGRTDEGPLC